MALAAVLNPIDNKEALVFYYSRQQTRNNLAVNSYSVTGGSDLFYADRNTSDGGVKPPPSDIAVTDFLGQIRVYGLAKMPRTTTSPGNLVSVVTQLSPTRNPIDKPSNPLTQPGDYSVITVCGNSTHGLVSYLKEIGGNIHLTYYTITKSKTSGHSEDVGVASYSKLASRIVDSHPLVFFQHKSGQYIYYYDVKDSATKKLGTTGTCAKGSHLAVTLGDSQRNILFLYYRNTNSRIVRVFRFNDKWSGEEEVSNHSIDDDSAIAVVAHKDYIHVFFWNNGEIVHEVNDVPDKSRLASASASAAAI